MPINSNAAATLTKALAHDSASPAIIVPRGGPTLLYAALAALVARLQARLAAAGIGAHDAVSIVLPNSLEFAVCFLAVAAQRAVACPLNPAYRQPEFEFYVDDVRSKLVVMPHGAVRDDAPAVKAARVFGAAVAEIWWDGVEMVLDVVECGALPVSVPVHDAQAEDVALVLHTSGTTGRPKAVGAACPRFQERDADDPRCL